MVPLKVTAVAFVKLPPLITTAIPGKPLVGEKLVSTGATKKLVELVLVPLGVAMVSFPVNAATGTTVWIWVSEVTWNVASAPPNWTELAPVK